MPKPFQTFLLALSVAAAVGVAALALAVPATNPSPNPAICRVDFGTTGALTDDGFYVSLDGDDDTVEVRDIRLKQFGSKGPGTLVESGDTTEVGQAATCQATTLVYYDSNANANFDSGDGAYVGYDKNGGGSVEASSSANEWWIRLAPFQGYSAGTLVLAGNTDLTSFGAGTNLPSHDFVYYDANANAQFDSGDSAYFTKAAAASGQSVPIGSIRVASPSYPFGSLVEPGTGDGAVTLNDPGTDAAICRIDFGAVGVPTDDTFYLGLDGDDDMVEANDIRLAPHGSNAPGTLVGDTDTAELAAANCQAYTVASADVNANGQFDSGDYLYVGYNKNTGQTLEGSSDSGDWWLRVTAAGSYAAGSIVVAGHTDLVNYGAVSTAFSASEWGWHDADASGSFAQADYGYLTSAAISNGDPVPLKSVRIHHPSLAYGSMVAFNDPEFGGIGSPTASPTTVTSSSSPTPTSASPTQTTHADCVENGQIVACPTSATPVTTPTTGTTATTGPGSTTIVIPPSDRDPALLTDPIPDAKACRLEFGQASMPFDDGFYLSFGPGDRLRANDIRLAAFQGSAAGTLVRDADTLERTAEGLECHPYALAWADVNANAAFDYPDHLYVGHNGDPSSLLGATSTSGDWWVRATPVGDKAAGTILHVADADYASWSSAAAPAPGELGYHDRDRNDRMGEGDRAYFTSIPISDETTTSVPLNSVRIVSAAYPMGSKVTVSDSDYAGPVVDIPTTPGLAFAVLVAGLASAATAVAMRRR